MKVVISVLKAKIEPLLSCCQCSAEIWAQTYFYATENWLKLISKVKQKLLEFTFILVQVFYSGNKVTVPLNWGALRQNTFSVCVQIRNTEQNHLFFSLCNSRHATHKLGRHMQTQPPLPFSKSYSFLLVQLSTEGDKNLWIWLAMLQL